MAARTGQALASPGAAAAVRLARGPEKSLLRFSTAGSVDDGKSTLIGRLLYESRGVYEDQLASVENSGLNRSSGPLDFSLLTDGLRAEREQGITIDVAYRYFSTARRKFIIADTPGHEQYTRNMATGASTAQLAVVLIDARKGVLLQSRRHACIASLLGIRRVVVAVNKMDLVEFRQDVFEAIEADFLAFARGLGFRETYFIPISALEGDNVVARSERTPWFHGRTFLDYLETVPVEDADSDGPFRLPVQYVIRPSLDFRGYAGQIASGSIRPGDEVRVLPSGRSARVKEIATYDGSLEEAFAPMSVMLTLTDEIDISRGNMIVRADETPPAVARSFDATLVWMNDAPLEPGRSYLLKHTTRQVRATVRNVRCRVDVNTLANEPARDLKLNEIGVVTIDVPRPVFFDSYQENRTTGAFILIDPFSNATLAAGMIRGILLHDQQRGPVSARERADRLGHEPAVIWLPGRKRLATLLERDLFGQGAAVSTTEGSANVRALTAAGLIAIVVSAEPPDDPLQLPELASEDEAAVEQIMKALEDSGVLHRAERFTGGEGI
ncbi:MAG: sulfate adenylyltransferase subunit CysN [Bryobacteraceae bacterium]|jgi:sulfate adenylyltransferase large subunit